MTKNAADVYPRFGSMRRASAKQSALCCRECRHPMAHDGGLSYRCLNPKCHVTIDVLG